MTTTVTPLTKEEATQLMESLKVSRQLPQFFIDKMKKDGWTIDEYSIELVYKGYPLVIEFCIGDFCTYPCSKNNHWLLEKKKSVETFFEALLKIEDLKARIDAGEHWVGEDD